MGKRDKSWEQTPYLVYTRLFCSITPIPSLYELPTDKILAATPHQTCPPKRPAPSDQETFILPPLTSRPRSHVGRGSNHAVQPRHSIPWHSVPVMKLHLPQAHTFSTHFHRRPMSNHLTTAQLRPATANTPDRNHTSASSPLPLSIAWHTGLLARVARLAIV